MRIISRAEWGAAPPTNSSTVDPGRRVATCWHYDDDRAVTVPARCDPGCREQIRATQRFHQKGRGWADIGYNFVVCQHGTIFEGRGWDTLGAHAGPAGNAPSIGVQIHVGGDQQPSDAARHAASDLHTSAEQRFGRPLNRKVHSDYVSTSCPGDVIRPWVRAGMPTTTQIPAIKEPTVTETAPEPWCLTEGARDEAGGMPIIRNALTDLYRKGFDFNKPSIVGPGLARPDMVNLQDYWAFSMGRPWHDFRGLTYEITENLRIEEKPQLDLHWWNIGFRRDVLLGEYALFKLGHFRWGEWLYDGVRGDETVAAIKRFQQSLGNTPDGELGPQQWRTLGEQSGIFTANPAMFAAQQRALPNAGGRIPSPVPGIGIGTPYGKQKAGLWRTKGYHTGDDYPGQEGAPCLAVVDGTVTVRDDSVLGCIAILSGVNGRHYWYCHTQRGSRATGPVKAGQQIARVGSTGSGALGPHLHLEDNSSPTRWGTDRKPAW